MKIEYVLLAFLLYIGQSIAVENEIETVAESGIELEASENSLLNIDGIKLIFPGTKWCGPGNISINGELGLLKDADQCCYDHDHCDQILPGDSKYGLTNSFTFSTLNCACDDALYECLKTAKCPVGALIETIYAAGQSKCFKEDYPIVKCIRYKIRVFMRRCVEYQLDTTQLKKYQFFDLPFYILD